MLPSLAHGQRLPRGVYGAIAELGCKSLTACASLLAAALEVGVFGQVAGHRAQRRGVSPRVAEGAAAVLTATLRVQRGVPGFVDRGLVLQNLVEIMVRGVSGRGTPTGAEEAQDAEEQGRANARDHRRGVPWVRPDREAASRAPVRTGRAVDSDRHLPRFGISPRAKARYSARTPPMPLVNHARRELHLKIVYYGPGLGGKTTNLELIHSRSAPSRRGKLVSLATESERTLFFDLLPVELGEMRGYRVRLHVCTVPGQIAYDATRRLVLRHVDGIVFVVDSQEARLDDAVESIRNLYDNLERQGDDPDRMPLVVQYNKRDLPGVLPIEVLAEALSVPANVTQYEAIATEGVGVFETLKAITKSCLKLAPEPSSLPDGRSPSILPGRRASMYAARGSGSPSVSVPRAPRVPMIALGLSDDGDG